MVSGEAMSFEDATGLFRIDYQNKGSLFTLFLTSPAFAFCFVCHLNELTSEQWNLCQEHVNQIMSEIVKNFLKSKLVGKRVRSRSCVIPNADRLFSR